MRANSLLRPARATLGWLYLAAALVALAVPLGALAQEPADTNVPARIITPRKQQDRISIDFVETPLSRAIELIAQQTGKNIVLDKGIDERVTVKLTDVPWTDALELIADRAGCIVEPAGENILRIRKPPRVTMTFTDADLKAAIDILAAQSGANVIVAENVEGKVNLRLKNVPWKQALEEVVKTSGYVLVEEEAGLLRVVHPDALALQLETWIFKLRYLRPPSTYVAKIQTNFAEGSPAAAQIKELQDLEKYFGVYRAIKSALSENGTIDYIPENNSLLVKDTVPKLEEIGRIVAEMDVAAAQVFVQVRFVSTTNDNLLQYGVDWASGIQIGQDSFGSVVSEFPFDHHKGGWEDNIAIVSEPWKSNGPTGRHVEEWLEESGREVNYEFGVFDMTQTSAFLRLVQKDTQSKIVQFPILTVLDNEASTIFSGQTVRFAEEVTTAGEAGSVVTAVQEAKNSPIETGFQLLIIPHIIPGSDEIEITVIPNATDLIAFDTFRVGLAEIDLPRTESRTVVTKMRLRSGQTAVLGGLVDTDEKETITRVPFLSAIPFLGRLFRHDYTKEVETALLILITIDIVQNADETTTLLAEDWSDAARDIIQTQTGFPASEPEPEPEE